MVVKWSCLEQRYLDCSGTGRAVTVVVIVSRGSGVKIVVVVAVLEIAVTGVVLVVEVVVVQSVILMVMAVIVVVIIPGYILIKQAIFGRFVYSVSGSGEKQGQFDYVICVCV